MTTPQERVRAFIDNSHESEDYIETGFDPEGRHLDLTVSDLRDVLNELDEHQRLLEQIDEALDQGDDFHVVLDQIRALLGNHTEDNL